MFTTNDEQLDAILASDPIMRRRADHLVNPSAEMFDLGGTEFTEEEVRDMSRQSGLSKIFAGHVPGGARVLSIAERQGGIIIICLLYRALIGRSSWFIRASQ